MAPPEPGSRNPITLVVVLAILALVASALFWQLHRQTSSPQAAGVGPLGNNPAAKIPSSQTRGVP